MENILRILKERSLALSSLLDFYIQGALVRSCYQNIVKMDAPLIFPLALNERMDKKGPFMHSLRSSTGQLLKKQKEI